MNGLEVGYFFSAKVGELREDKRDHEDDVELGGEGNAHSYDDEEVRLSSEELKIKDGN